MYRGEKKKKKYFAFNLEVNTQAYRSAIALSHQTRTKPWNPTYIVADVLAFNDKWHPKYLIALFIEFKTLNYFGTFIYFTYC